MCCAYAAMDTEVRTTNGEKKDEKNSMYTVYTK